MEIRNARQTDLPQLAKLKNWGGEKPYIHRIDLTDVGQASYLVADQDGMIVGHAYLKYCEPLDYLDCADIEDVFVIEASRGTGIGSAIIATCEELAQERGFRRIGLSVNPTLNPRALALYERLGFKNVGRPLYLGGVYDGDEDWVIDMIKDLP